VGNQRDWTPGRLTILTLLLLDLAALIVWAVANYEHYKTLSVVSGAVWGATLTVLTYLKVRAPKERTFAEFLGDPPVRLTVVLVTLLMLGGSVGLAPRQLPIQRVDIAVVPIDISRPEIVIWTQAGDTLVRQSVDPNPLTVHLPAGSHRLLATAPGFEPDTQLVAVRSYGMIRPQTHTVRLYPYRGTLLFPPMQNLRMEVDVRHAATDTTVAQRIVQSDTLRLDLSPDRYRIITSAPQYRSDTTLIDLPPGGVIAYPVELTRIGVGPTYGTVSLQTQPPGADVIIRGRGAVGTTPAVLRLPPGEYHAVIRRVRTDLSPTAAEEFTRSVRVERGATVTVRGDLEPMTLARLTMGASPDGSGRYVAIEQSTGLEHSIGTASGEASVLLFPGTFQLRRRTAAGAITGPTIALASGVVVSRPGF
jgi:hypothetical protein